MKVCQHINSKLLNLRKSGDFKICESLETSKSVKVYQHTDSRLMNQSLSHCRLSMQMQVSSLKRSEADLSTDMKYVGSQQLIQNTPKTLHSGRAEGHGCRE